MESRPILENYASYANENTLFLNNAMSQINTSFRHLV